MGFAGKKRLGLHMLVFPFKKGFAYKKGIGLLFRGIQCQFA